MPDSKSYSLLRAPIHTLCSHFRYSHHFVSLVILTEATVSGNLQAAAGSMILVPGLGVLATDYRGHLLGPESQALVCLVKKEFR